MVLSLTCSLLQQKEIAHWFPKVWFWWGVVAIAGEEWRGVGGHTFVSFVVLLFCCCCCYFCCFPTTSRRTTPPSLLFYNCSRPSVTAPSTKPVGQVGKKSKTTKGFKATSRGRFIFSGMWALTNPNAKRSLYADLQTKAFTEEWPTRKGESQRFAGS